MEYKIDTDFIYSQCRKYAMLNDEEIEQLIDMAKQLPYFSAVNNTDVFIDIKIYNEDKVLIIAEFFGKESLYKNSFLGSKVSRNNEPAVFRSFDLGLRTSDIVCVSFDTVDGEGIVSKQTTVPIKSKNGVIGVLTVEKPMDCFVPQLEKPIKEIELVDNESENIFFEILGFRNKKYDGQMKEGILLYNTEGYLVYSNNTANNIYESLGFNQISGLYFDNMIFLEKTFLEIVGSNNKSINGDNTNMPINLHEGKSQIDDKFYNIRIISVEHQNISVVVFIEDITNYQLLEKKMEKYLVSYQEIHHRVKNNLQTIASLLRLQGRSCDDIKCKNILSDSINRIVSIAVTHELLSQNNGDEASIMGVVRQLKTNIINFGMTEMQNITIEIVGTDFVVDSQKSTAVALIINELIQNSAKYAYPNNKNGKITITIANDDGYKMVEVKDYGIGYNPNKVRKGSLGLEIVNSYVYEKLNGKLVVNTGKQGTTTLFAFR